MQSTTTDTTPSVTDKGTHHQRGALDRELYCPRLERLLMSAASELGHRGNLAQVVASIERGGVGGGGEDPNLGMLRRLGATDTRGIDNRVGQIRELELRWRGLGQRHQATALALYVGTPRAHPTLREHFGQGQGGLAGVVLYRWQGKQAKARAREPGVARVAGELERVRAELSPIEREIADCRAKIEAPMVLPPHEGPRPERPEVPLVLAPKLVKAAFAAHRAAVRAWDAPVRKAVSEAHGRRQAARERLEELTPQTGPLRVEVARLCAQQAALAAAGDVADDELALVKQCRGGLARDAKELLRAAAEADVRALHKAWYLTARRAAKAWAEDGSPA